MKKIYHLGTCSTCKKILKDVEAKKNGAELQDIKTENITAAQLDEMKKLAGSYEALFSRKALKYRSMGLDKKILEEKELRKLILHEYTFLKRPVAVVDGNIFIGNASETIHA